MNGSKTEVGQLSTEGVTLVIFLSYRRRVEKMLQLAAQELSHIEIQSGPDARRITQGEYLRILQIRGSAMLQCEGEYSLNMDAVSELGQLLRDDNSFRPLGYTLEQKTRLYELLDRGIDPLLGVDPLSIPLDDDGHADASVTA